MAELQCPHCHENDMEVISGSFVAKGVRLYKDGFSFYEAKQIDTEDETVRCNHCDEIFPLTEVIGYGEDDDEDEAEAEETTAEADNTASAPSD